MTDLILIDWMKKWLEVYKLPMVKEQTQNMYLYAISLLEKTPVASMPISKITEIDLQTTLNFFAKQHYSKSTISKVRLSLKQAYKVLAKNNTIDFNPTQELRLPLAP